MDSETIVLVDDAGTPVGTAPKLASHHADTPLHKAFSCFIFNSEGKFLLTQRAHSKKVWPDVWTNSVCGHPAPEESDEEAIRRRSEFELGISDIHDIQLVDPNYRYTTPAYNGIIENEICPIYIARSDQKFTPNPDEVEAFEWVDWSTISALFAKEPDTYSYWFKQEYPIVAAYEGIKSYTS